METENKKPKAKVIGQDGNVFNLMGICSKALKQAGQKEQSEKMTDEIFNSGSYDEALTIMRKYCDLY